MRLKPRTRTTPTLNLSPLIDVIFIHLAHKIDRTRQFHDRNGDLSP